MKACERCGANEFRAFVTMPSLSGRFNDEGLFIAQRCDPNDEQIVCQCVICGHTMEGEISWDYEVE